MTERFSVTYRIFAASEAEAEQRAQGIALEQTVEIPRDVVPAGYVEDTILGRIEDILPDDEAAGSGPAWTAKISYSPDSAGPDLPQFLNVVFGNSSIQKGIKVIGVDLCPSLADLHTGARHGIDGVRSLCRRDRGGLVSPVIKPMGLTTEDLALTVERVTEAGADLIKEDHGLANQPTAPMRERIPRLVEATARGNARRQAGGDQSKGLYFPNLGGSTRNLVDDAWFAKQEGADGVLIIPGLQGFDAISTLARDPEFGLPIMAHPSFLGPFVLSPDTGFTHGVMFGTLMRIAGADISIFPNFGGRFGFTQQECGDIAAACRNQAGPGRPILPSPGGGMVVSRMPELMEFYGEDSVYLLGGGLLRYGERIGDGVREMKAVLQP